MQIVNIFRAVCLSALFLPPLLNGQTQFQTDDGLRIDFILTGNHEHQSATIFNYRKTPNLHSRKAQAIPDFDYGSYRLIILNFPGNDTLFLKGFCTLFEEWQFSLEAKEKKRAFTQTVEVPWPEDEVLVKIERRDNKGTFQPLLKEKFSPSKTITRLIPKQFPEKIIHGTDEPFDQLDFLILAEGYTRAETDNFFSDAWRLSSELLKTKPYHHLANKITIRALAVHSDESGVDDPRRNIWKNTAMNSSFNTFNTDRYLESTATWKIFDYAAACPRDHIIVLVNSNKYGGGGVYNHFSITSASHPKSAHVLIHEIGHGFAGLGDEYYSSEVSFSDFFNLETEPWHPNITTMVDFESKWKKLIDESTPLPTPAQKKYRNITGLFEGAGYSEKGIYRPALKCRMKSNEADGFCEVCKQSIEKMVNFYSK